MARQLSKAVRNCRECLAFREAAAPEEARCALKDMAFGTHPVDKSAAGWCPLRSMSVLLEYKGR